MILHINEKCFAIGKVECCRMSHTQLLRHDRNRVQNRFCHSVIRYVDGEYGNLHFQYIAGYRSLNHRNSLLNPDDYKMYSNWRSLVTNHLQVLELECY